jgi:metallo-beta-lactamase family protein
MGKKPQHTFIVHGEDDSSASLADALRGEIGLENVIIPDVMQSFEV